MITPKLERGCPHNTPAILPSRKDRIFQSDPGWWIDFNGSQRAVCLPTLDLLCTLAPLLPSLPLSLFPSLQYWQKPGQCGNCCSQEAWQGHSVCHGAVAQVSDTAVSVGCVSHISHQLCFHLIAMMGRHTGWIVMNQGH